MACVVVLGLPRSGASAVAGILMQLGINMGEHLRPPSSDNPKGYVEDLDFASIHSVLLGAEDGLNPYGILPPDRQAWLSYANLIRNKECQVSWGLKDPKLCFLLPYFATRLESNLKVIVVQRRFHSVVKSWMKTNPGSTASQAILALGHYQKALCESVEAMPPAVPVMRVRYERLCRCADDETAAISRFTERLYRSAAARFVDPSLDHHGDRTKSSSRYNV